MTSIHWFSLEFVCVCLVRFFSVVVVGWVIPTNNLYKIGSQTSRIEKNNLRTIHYFRLGRHENLITLFVCVCVCLCLHVYYTFIHVYYLWFEWLYFQYPKRFISNFQFFPVYCVVIFQWFHFVSFHFFIIIIIELMMMMMICVPNYKWHL